MGKVKERGSKSNAEKRYLRSEVYSKDEAAKKLEYSSVEEFMKRYKDRHGLKPLVGSHNGVAVFFLKEAVDIAQVAQEQKEDEAYFIFKCGSSCHPEQKNSKKKAKQ